MYDFKLTLISVSKTLSYNEDAKVDLGVWKDSSMPIIMECSSGILSTYFLQEILSIFEKRLSSPVYCKFLYFQVFSYH
jgi:hypothetical protein